MLPVYAKLFPLCRRSLQNVGILARNDSYCVQTFTLSALLPRRLRSRAAAQKSFQKKMIRCPVVMGKKIKIVLCNAEYADKSPQNVSGKNSIRSTKIVITKK